MPFIWNDSTLRDKISSEQNRFFKIDIFLYILSFFIWGIFVFQTISLFELLILAYPTYLFIYTGVNIFLQFPHSRIPNTYSDKMKTLYYIFHFILAIFLLFFVTVGILQYYFLFFEKLVCCDLISNFDIRGVLPK